MKDTPAAPPAPDYLGAANAQGAANRDTAIAQARLSNPNVYTPYGSQEVTYGGPEGLDPTVRQFLSPEGQEQLNLQNQARLELASGMPTVAQNIRTTLSTPFESQGPSVQTSLEATPEVATAPDLFGIGQANQGPAAAQGIQNAPDAGLFGMAGSVQPGRLAPQGPDNAVYAGGTPNFNESTGERTTDPDMGLYAGHIPPNRTSRIGPARMPYSGFGVSNDAGTLRAADPAAIAAEDARRGVGSSNVVGVAPSASSGALQPALDLLKSGDASGATNALRAWLGLPLMTTTPPLVQQQGGDIQNAPTITPSLPIDDRRSGGNLERQPVYPGITDGWGNTEQQGGDIQNAPRVGQYGYAQQNVYAPTLQGQVANAEQIQAGPTDGQYGMAQGGVEFQQAGGVDTGQQAQGISNHFASAQGVSNAFGQLQGINAGEYGQAGGVGGAGQGIAGAPDAFQFGQASGNVAAGQNMAQTPNLFEFGQAQRNLSLPSLQGSVDNPQLQRNIGTPTLQTSLGDVGRPTGTVNRPSVQRSLADTGGPQRTFDTSNVAALPVNAGTTGQAAIMSRLQPQIERERSQLETQLRNQGLVPGGEAYNNAMQIQNQRENDMLTQATLQGMGLDITANQQGFAQAQALGQFGNTAQQQAYNQALGAGQFGNLAAGQEFGQNLQATQLGNQAQGQEFNQRLAAGEFGNQGMLGQFGAGLAAGQFGNQAAGQQFGQSVTAANLANQAALGGFGAQLQAGQFGNQALAQNQQTALQQQQAQNAAQQQAFAQQFGVAGLQNQAIAQNVQQALAQQQAQNQAQAQGFGQQMGAQQLQNQAVSQNFGQGVQAAQLGNQAVTGNLQNAIAAQNTQNQALGQNYNQTLGAQQLQNAAAGQNFGQNLSAQQLANQAYAQNAQLGLQSQAAGNQAIAQNFGQGVTAAQLQNQQQQQQFGQNLAGGNFANQAAQDQFGMGIQNANLYNQGIQQNFNQALAAQGAQNQAQQQGFGQQLSAQQLQNQAIQQNQQAAFQQQAAQNAAQAQGYGQQANTQQMNNAAVAQNQATALQEQQAANQAVAQQFNQQLAGAQFGNTAQQQQLQQALYQRNLPLNEISALMSGSQIMNPQFQGYQGANIQAAPLYGAAQQQGTWNQNLYNQQVGMQNANTQGLYGLGAAAAYAFSDRRLKSNIIRIGTHPLGIGIYDYDIFGHRERGVMADEVLAVKPEAVLQHASGFLMVDYGRL